MLEKSHKSQKAEARASYRRQWAKKKKRSSSTPGSVKNEATCQATSLQRFMAKAARSRRHPAYASWCASKRG